MAAYEEAKERAAEVRRNKLDVDWRICAGHFEDDAKPNLVTYPEGAACIIPDERRWDVAAMQVELRAMIERSIRFDDGTQFSRYAQSMRDDKTWKLDEALPMRPKLRMGEKRLNDVLDSRMEAAQLPERTRVWFRTLYGTMLGHARNLADRGRGLAGRTEWLFGEITKEAPTGKVKTLFTPVSIHFRCEKKVDCARLIYPNPAHQERRTEAEEWRGAQVVHKLPDSLGGFRVPVSVENFEVTKGNDSFGTFEHEQDHAVNNYFISRNTLLGDAPNRETGLESCARAALACPVKEELLAWSLRPKTDFKGLFLGKGASYTPVKNAARRLRERKVQQEEVDAFIAAADAHLQKLVPGAVRTLDKLMASYSHPAVREILRTLPVHKWSAMQSTLTRNDD